MVFVPPGIIFEGSGRVIDVAVEFKDGGGTLMHASRSVNVVEEDEPITMVVTALTIGGGRFEGDLVVFAGVGPHLRIPTY